MTSAQFSDTFDTYTDQGLRSLDFEAIETGSGRRDAGIWVENRSGRGWYLYRDLTSTQYRNRWNQMADKGYRLDNFEKYPTRLWRALRRHLAPELRAARTGRCAPRSTPSSRTSATARDITGISVAIAHQGETVYLERGQRTRTSPTACGCTAAR